MTQKKLLFTFSLLLPFWLFLIISCKENEEDEILISKIGLMKSHNAGEECTTCHKSGGTGEGIFQIAGTVYDSNGININPNGKIELYTGTDSNRVLIKTIEIDGKGNFYTTESVDFSANNIHVSVTGFYGKTKFMTGIPGNGKCNSCHGSTASKIWIY